MLLWQLLPLLALAVGAQNATKKVDATLKSATKPVTLKKRANTIVGGESLSYNSADFAKDAKPKNEEKTTNDAKPTEPPSFLPFPISQGPWSSPAPRNHPEYPRPDTSYPQPEQPDYPQPRGPTYPRPGPREYPQPGPYPRPQPHPEYLPQQQYVIARPPLPNPYPQVELRPVRPQVIVPQYPQAPMNIPSFPQPQPQPQSQPQQYTYAKGYRRVTCRCCCREENVSPRQPSGGCAGIPSGGPGYPIGPVNPGHHGCDTPAYPRPGQTYPAPGPAPAPAIPAASYPAPGPRPAYPGPAPGPVVPGPGSAYPSQAGQAYPWNGGINPRDYDLSIEVPHPKLPRRKPDGYAEEVVVPVSPATVAPKEKPNSSASTFFLSAMALTIAGCLFG
ncbi:unnamed protein product, partial [Mesorhabditis spiculigera]